MYLSHVFILQPNLYAALAFCFSGIPYEVVENITSGDLDKPETVVKGAIIRCLICGAGIQSLNWLNKAIECSIHLDKKYVKRIYV